ncbi:MAG: hypothetical protein NTNFB02_33040 [Nitrospira sp.]
MHPRVGDEVVRLKLRGITGCHTELTETMKQTCADRAAASDPICIATGCDRRAEVASAGGRRDGGCDLGM